MIAIRMANEVASGASETEPLTGFEPIGGDEAEAPGT